MTAIMESPIAGLTVESIDEQTGRIRFEPAQRRTRGKSKHNANQYLFDGLTGFWDWNGPELEIGQWYELRLTAKAKPAGPNTNPGSMYLDIQAAVKLDGPTGTADTPATPDTPTGWPDVRGEVRGHVENLAMSLYIAHVGDGNRIVNMWSHHDHIRILRDTLYHQITNKPIAPEHYCYHHEEVRWQSSTGLWGHIVEGIACIEESEDDWKGFVDKLEAADEQGFVDEPEAAEEPEPQEDPGDEPQELF
mgnify:CR=1 FL=1